MCVCVCVCKIIIMISLCAVTLHRTRHDIDVESRHITSVYLSSISQDLARGITSVSVSECCVPLSLNDVGCVRGIVIGFLVFVFGGGMRVCSMMCVCRS